MVVNYTDKIPVANPVGAPPGPPKSHHPHAGPRAGPQCPAANTRDSAPVFSLSRLTDGSWKVNNPTSSCFGWENSEMHSTPSPQAPQGFEL